MGKSLGQNLTICLVSKTKDYFGVYEVKVNINGKERTFLVTSEFILRKIEKAVRNRHFKKAIYMLSAFEEDLGFGRKRVQRGGDGARKEAGNRTAEEKEGSIQNDASSRVQNSSRNSDV